VTGIYILFGGIALFAGIVTGLDLWADRQHRKAQRH